MTTTDVLKMLLVFAKQYYLLNRQGAFDFPEEKEWCNKEVHRFKLNYPELFRNN